MNLIENLTGELCKIILPINEEVFFGNPKSPLAVCTLSSMKLLKEIANTNLMSKIALIGRLFSENKGIDSLVRYVISNKNLETILLCGKDNERRIISSCSPDPVLTITKSEVLKFQKQVKLVDKIGETNISTIKLS